MSRRWWRRRHEPEPAMPTLSPGELRRLADDLLVALDAEDEIFGPWHDGGLTLRGQQPNDDQH